MEPTPTPVTDSVWAALLTHSRKLERERAMLREALTEAGLQIDYLQGKFYATGTSAAVLARISAALEATK